MTTQINETISVRIDAADNGTCELWAYSDNGVDIQVENVDTIVLSQLQSVQSDTIKKGHFKWPFNI